MDFLENLGSKISQAGSGASQRFKKMQGVSALNSQINKLEASLTDLYCSLGAKYYSAYGSDPHPEFETFCESIGQVKEQIDALQSDLRLLRATTVCQNCGASLKEGSAFCPGCGTKVPQLPVAQSKVCTKCGASIDSSSAFCAKCGAPVPADEPAANLCPNCGKELRPDVRFCPSCGCKTEQ